MTLLVITLNLNLGERMGENVLNGYSLIILGELPLYKYNYI